MITVHNSETLQQLRQGAQIQAGTDITPSRLSDQIVPVLETNPELLRRTNFTADSSGAVSGNVTTTFPSTGDLYITGFNVSMIKDATCDVASGTLNVTLLQDETGRTASICRIAVLTTTAQTVNLTHTLYRPIRVRAGSQAIYSGTFTAGNMVRSFVFHGYIISNPNG